MSYIGSSRLLEAASIVGRMRNPKAKDGERSTSFRFGGSLRDDFMDALPQPRKRFAVMLSSMLYQKLLSAIVLFNVVCAMVEVDAAITDDVPQWVIGCNYAILSFFVGEMVVKLYVYRKRFFDDTMNVADFIIVALDLLCSLLEAVLDMPNMSVFRAFRLVRLLRTRQVLKIFPQMNTLVKGLFGAVQICVGGLVLLVLVLILFAIFAVQLFYDVSMRLAADGSFPSDSFDSIWHAMLTLFNIAVANDGWADVVRPLVEAYPPFAIFFLFLFIIITVTLLNMMLAVIVTEADACLNRDLADRAERRDDEMREACAKFSRLFAKMDTDNSGTVCYDELREAAERNKEFADLLFTIEIDKSEMEVLFKVLDKNGSGDVSTDEFSREMYKMKSSSDHAMLISIKAYVHEIFRTVSEQVNLLNERMIVQLGNEELLIRRLEKELPALMRISTTSVLENCDWDREHSEEVRSQLSKALEEKMSSIQKEFSALGTHLLRKGGSLQEEKLKCLSMQFSNLAARASFSEENYRRQSNSAKEDSELRLCSTSSATDSKVRAGPAYPCQEEFVKVPL